MSGHTELWTLPELSVSPSPSSAQPAEHIRNVAIKYFMLNYLYNMRCMLSVNMQLNSEASSRMVHPEIWLGAQHGHLTFNI
jgi:hypothetical protein